MFVFTQPGWGRKALTFHEEADDVSGGEGESSSQPQTPPQAPPFDPKALANELGPVLGQHMTQALQSQRQPTPEDIAQAKKLLNIWEPDDAFVQRFSNLDTQKQAFVELRDALFRQNFTAVERFWQEREQALMERISPIMEHYQRSQVEAQMGRLHAAYPALKDPNVAPIVNAVAQEFRAKGRTFNDEASLFKALAEGVQAVIKHHNPEFTLEAAAQAASSQRNGNALPSSTAGSGGGGGRSTGAQQQGNKPRAVQLLEG